MIRDEAIGPCYLSSLTSDGDTVSAADREKRLTSPGVTVSSRSSV